MAHLAHRRSHPAGCGTDAGEPGQTIELYGIRNYPRGAEATRAVRYDGGGGPAVDIATHDIEKELPGGLLDEAGDGRTRLPDLRRGRVRDDARVGSLFASISPGRPIGARA